MCAYMRIILIVLIMGTPVIGQAQCLLPDDVPSAKIEFHSDDGVDLGAVDQNVFCRFKRRADSIHIRAHERVGAIPSETLQPGDQVRAAKRLIWFNDTSKRYATQYGALPAGTTLTITQRIWQHVGAIKNLWYKFSVPAGVAYISYDQFIGWYCSNAGIKVLDLLEAEKAPELAQLYADWAAESGTPWHYVAVEAAATGAGWLHVCNRGG